MSVKKAAVALGIRTSAIMPRISIERDRSFAVPVTKHDGAIDERHDLFADRQGELSGELAKPRKMVNTFGSARPYSHVTGTLRSGKGRASSVHSASSAASLMSLMLSTKS